MLPDQATIQRQEDEIQRLQARIDELVDSEAAWAFSANGQLTRADQAELRANAWRQIAEDLAAPHFILSPDLRAEKFREALDAFAEKLRAEQ